MYTVTRTQSDRERGEGKKSQFLCIENDCQTAAGRTNTIRGMRYKYISVQFFVFERSDWKTLGREVPLRERINRGFEIADIVASW